MGFIFDHFVYEGSFVQIWVKTAELPSRSENFHFGGHFTNYGIPYCSFLI